MAGALIEDEGTRSGLEPASGMRMGTGFPGERRIPGRVAWHRSAPRVVLASRSPRRRELLEASGYPFEVAPAVVDDAGLCPGVATPPDWVMALAFLKARAVEQQLEAAARSGTVVVGADTVCVQDDRIIGQPADAASARAMLEALSGRSHAVLTGVAIIHAPTGRRDIFFDGATIELGRLGSDLLEPHLASGGWSGRAGGYNLAEVVEAGWPVRWRGGRDTVMGLPVALLAERVARLLDRGEG